jgi:tRNA (guanine-N7-)-methyltransferase
LNDSEAYFNHVRQRQETLRETCQGLFAEKASFTLELGCGHGHFLTAYARAFPEEFCVGVDLITKRVEKANTKALKHGLNNLHFVKAEAYEFLNSLPDGLKLNRIFMLFPDPWPKKRHHKNRMVQSSFMSILAERCLPGAEFAFRTDHAGYFEWTQECLDSHPEWRIAPEIPWRFEEASYFQNLMSSWQSLVAVRN